jgi:hypothetical protein
MKPPTATFEDIKAHQDRLEKGKIKPDDLRPCIRCELEACYFKLHAYRERIFRVLVEMIIQEARCCLVRFRCPGCDKTYTHYPPFAIPYKRYTRQTITAFSEQYVETDHLKYEHAVMMNHEAAVTPDGKGLAPSTIHRWITTLSGYIETTRKALSLLLQADPMSRLHRVLAQVTVAARKYRSEDRKQRLIRCRRLGRIEREFADTFETSIFTKLAIGCRFG